jgi:hypothetical protein
MSQWLFDVFSDENKIGFSNKNKFLKRHVIAHLDGANNTTIADLLKNFWKNCL